MFVKKEIENTAYEWEKLYIEFIEQNKQLNQLVIDMTPEGQARHIFNLCHLFPFANALHKKGYISDNSPLKVTIKTNLFREKEELKDKNNETNFKVSKEEVKPDLIVETDDAYRVRQFLSQIRTPYIKFDLEGRIVRKQRYGRIFPIIEVSNKVELESNDSTFYRDLRKTFNECCSYSSALMRIANDIYSYLNDLDTYKGFSKAEEEKKQRTRKETLNYVNQFNDSMEVLSFVIWIMLLLELLRSGKITEEHSEDELGFLKRILYKSRYDAISYGEAVYQLLENACIHSEGHKAWFSFYMHRVANPQQNDAKEEDKNRFLQLMEKYNIPYEKNNLDGKVNYYLDFIVLDDASYIEVEKKKDSPSDNTMEVFTKGIVDTYNDRINNDRKDGHKDEDKKNLLNNINSITELINKPPRENKNEFIEDITMHYGLKLFEHIVKYNCGLIMCETPYFEKEMKESGVLYFWANSNKTIEKNLRVGESISWKNKNGVDLFKEVKRFETIWSFLIPVQHKVREEIKTDISNKISFLEEGYSCRRTKTVCIENSKLIDKNEWTYEKWKDIKLARKKINNVFVSIDNLSDTVFIIKYDEYAYSMEIFTKALFAVIADHNYNKKNDKISFMIALILKNKDKVFDLIRYFAILYCSSNQKSMNGVQIALCSHNDESHVDAIITGEKFSEVLRAVKYYSYHYPDNILEHMEIIRYLSYAYSSNEEKTDENRILPLFPFDLFLPDTFENQADNEQINTEWDSNWFIKKIKKILNTSIRDREFGTRINNVHARLGSKIHINTFFEAELLFRDWGNISRFAFLLYQELLYGDTKLEECENVLLLGYEKYSVSMMLILQDWMRKCGHFTDIHTAIVYDEIENGDNKVRIEKYFENYNELSGITRVVTVVPVGTTLSTFYKVHGTIRKELKIHGIAFDRNVFGNNYCLVLVGNKNDVPLSITARYWEVNDPQKHIVSVRPNENGFKGINVKYLTMVSTEWYDPENCPCCKMTTQTRIQPLINVKNSEMLPDSIFLGNWPRKGTFHELLTNEVGLFLKGDKYNIPTYLHEHNDNKLKCLFGCIKYSHIYSKNSHYQFFIDFKKFYLYNEVEICKYLESCEKNVSQDEFHIIISPLRINIASYAKAVLEHVFHGSAYFLQFRIEDEYREEVRTEFSYIVEAYRILKRQNSNVKMRIHFVDSSIINGFLINRAISLMRMLLTQSGLYDEEFVCFDSIYLLVNRCSYDTLHNYTKVPENVYAFLNIAIPSYNTESDKCPACRLVMRYELLGKRSSTDLLSAEFRRLSKKHVKQTEEEYEEKLNRDILNNSSYFGWLLQWFTLNQIDEKTDQLKCYVSEDMEGIWEGNYHYAQTKAIDTAKKLGKCAHFYLSLKIINQVNECIRKHKVQNDYNTINKLEDLFEIIKDHEIQQIILKCLSNINIYKVLNYVKKNKTQISKKYNIERIPDEEEVIQLVRTYLVDVRDYMRFYCMHKAYEWLEIPNGIFEKDQNEERCKKYIDIMLRLLCMKLKSDKKKEDNTNESIFDIVCKTEWLISYLKVLSRTHIVNYYDYRQAIENVLFNFYELFFKDNEEAKQLKQKLCKDNKDWNCCADLVFTLRGIGKEEMNPLFALMRYQVTTMLIHRMADLQMNHIIKPKDTLFYVKTYMVCVDECLQKFSTTWNPFYWICFPDEKSATKRYLKSVKTATMMSNDDIPCIALTDYMSQYQAMTDVVINDKCEKMFSKLINGIYLENTRMLYSGMKDIEIKIDDFESVSEKPMFKRDFCSSIQELTEKTNKVLRDCYDNLDGESEAKIEDILYQNILGGFCRFIHKSTSKSPLPSDQSRIAHMLYYYKTLQQLSKSNNKRDLLPYLYEGICRSICGISGADMCYIVHKDEGADFSVITQSGYHKDFLRDQLDEDSSISDIINKIILNFESRNGNLTISKGNYEELYEQSISTYVYKGTSVLAVYLETAQDKNISEGFYIFMFKRVTAATLIRESNEKISNNKMLEIARNILFMRQTLVEVLDRDYTKLINLRYDYSYVMPYSSEDESVRPIILHLSDLHIGDDIEIEKYDIASAIKKAIGEKNIDLLMISGDVADGKRASAPIMEKRYKQAENFFDNLVKCLWCDRDGYLPHDWRKHIIISTGNHDYASMNQYQSALTRRDLIPGMPIEDESSSMSKFSYYYDFLIRYLDAPIDQLLANDLNEIRNYENFNLKVLILNCSSKATPRRTNKLGVNWKAVQHIIQQYCWMEDETKEIKRGDDIVSERPIRICLAHYAPTYSLSYFIDKYGHLPAWEYNACSEAPINRLVKYYFVNAIREEAYNRVPYGIVCESVNSTNAFIQEFEKFERALECIKNNYQISAADWGSQLYFDYLIPHAKKKSKPYEFVKEMRKNELYKMMKTFYEWLKGTKDRSNEIISRMITETMECIIMGYADKQNYINNIKQIIHSTESGKNGIDLFLAGHIHAYDERKPNEIEMNDKNVNFTVLVAGKAFQKINDKDNKVEIQGYVISDIAESNDKNGISFVHNRLLGICECSDI